MARECAFEAQRALLEIIVVVGRHLGWVAGPDEGVEIVDHEGGAAKDSAEASGFGRNVEAVHADAIAGGRRRPWLEGRNVGMRRGVGLGIGAFRCEVVRSCGEKANNAAATRD